MRKYLIIPTAVLLSAVLFTACKPSEKQKRPDLNLLYTCKADILWGETEAEAEFKRLGNGDWDIFFTGPDTLSGLTVSFRDGTAHCEMNGVSADIPNENIPDGSLFDLVCGALDSGASDTGDCVADENLLIGKGHNQNGDYELIFTADTMELCGIKIPDSGLEAVIEDFQTIDVPPAEAAS